MYEVYSSKFRPPVPPKRYSWYRFLLRTLSHPGTQCGWKDYISENSQWGIEPATFRLVAQCLNQLRHRTLHEHFATLVNQDAPTILASSALRWRQLLWHCRYACSEQCRRTATPSLPNGPSLIFPRQEVYEFPFSSIRATFATYPILIDLKTRIRTWLNV